jgi:hypothetical protein
MRTVLGGFCVLLVLAVGAVHVKHAKKHRPQAFKQACTEEVYRVSVREVVHERTCVWGRRS